MAQVRWGGETFTAKPIEQNADGSWIMEALQHTGRTAPGTRITVQPGEIVAGTMPAAGQADTTTAPADDGKATLEAAMAEERKTLVSPADLIAKAQAAKTAATTQGDAGAVPPGPTPAPAAAPQNQGKGMTHLADKGKLLADALNGLKKSTEAKLDAALAEVAAKQKAVDGLDDTFNKIGAITSDVDDTVATINSIAAALTNQ